MTNMPNCPSCGGKLFEQHRLREMWNKRPNGYHKISKVAPPRDREILFAHKHRAAKVIWDRRLEGFIRLDVMMDPIGEAHEEPYTHWKELELPND